MTKRYKVSEADIQHYVAPELKGRIVGLRDEALRPQTVEEIEALQKQAYEEAKQAGYNDGLQKGLDELKQQANRLQSMFNFFQHPLEELDVEVEHQLADLAVLIAQQLFAKESSLNAQHIHNLVHESLDYLPVKARDVRVRLNPDDIALLNQAEIDTNDQVWACVSDNTVSAGGCIIESDTSHIDATVETRIQQLVDQLNLHQADNSSGEGEDGAD